MDKKQVQEAIVRIDNILGKARFTEPLLNREDHIILVNDIKLVQQCCAGYFSQVEAVKKVIPENEDGGTNIIPIRPESGNEDSEGSGDSV